MPEERPAAVWPLVAFPALKLAVYLLTAGGYGYFRDELYYLACSRRMAWGCVDHPPLCVAAIWAWRHAFGESMIAIRSRAALGCAHCMPYERETHVYVCRALRQRLAERWPRLKHYD